MWEERLNHLSIRAWLSQICLKQTKTSILAGLKRKREKEGKVQRAVFATKEGRNETDKRDWALAAMNLLIFRRMLYNLGKYQNL